ncbi:hypothetical protein PVAND_007422 [Polypedilum vanderplanki]|nr:hypothetical protein PVAND_007422 [Polypedilum vanderplanki]
MIELREQFAFQFEQQLVKTPAIYSYKKGNINFISLPQGLKNFNLPNILQFQNPGLVVAFLLKNSDIEGNRLVQQFSLENHDLIEFAFLKDNQRLSDSFKLLFSDTEMNYAAAYNSTIDALQLKFGSNLIDYLKYKDKFILAADYSTAKTSTSELLSPSQSCSIGCILNFKEDIKYPLTLCLYTQSDFIFTINHKREVKIITQ